MRVEKVIGLFGAIFFGISAYPQVYHVWSTGDTSSLSGLFLIFWGLGISFTWVYVVLENMRNHRWQFPLHLNYGFNLFSLLYLLWIKFFG